MFYMTKRSTNNLVFSNYHQAFWSPEQLSLCYSTLASYHLDHKNIQDRRAFCHCLLQSSHLRNRKAKAKTLSPPTQAAIYCHHSFSLHIPGEMVLQFLVQPNSNQILPFYIIVLLLCKIPSFYWQNFSY